MKIIFAVAAALLSSSAFAGSAGSGLVTTFNPKANGVVLIQTTGTRQSAPSCGSAAGSRFAFDASTTAGLAMLEGFKIAYENNRPVVIEGTGDCAIHNQSESISDFYFYTGN